MTYSRRISDVASDELAGIAFVTNDAIDSFERLLHGRINTKSDIDKIEQVLRAIVFHNGCHSLEEFPINGILKSERLITHYNYGPFQFSTDELPELPRKVFENSLSISQDFLSNCFVDAVTSGPIAKVSNAEEAKIY